LDLTQSPYFSMLKARIGFASERQRLIAENVANVSTPGYVPRDLDERAFQRTLEAAAPRGGSGGLAPVQMTRTNAGHLPATGGPSAGAGLRPRDQGDMETTVDGNQVVVEEQMLRLTETRQSFDAAMSLYQKGLDMIRLAARAPGR
jgi:flagellar basal-body rod protein FlgB